MLRTEMRRLEAEHRWGQCIVFTALSLWPHAHMALRLTEVFEQALCLALKHDVWFQRICSYENITPVCAVHMLGCRAYTQSSTAAPSVWKWRRLLRSSARQQRWRLRRSARRWRRLQRCSCRSCGSCTQLLRRIRRRCRRSSGAQGAVHMCLQHMGCIQERGAVCTAGWSKAGHDFALVFQGLGACLLADV